MNIIQRNTEHFLKYAELFLNTCWTKFLYTMNIFYTHWTFFQCMVNNIQIHIELFFKYDELLLNACWTKFLYMMNIFLYTLNIFSMYGEHFSSIRWTKIWNSKLFLKREQNSKTWTKFGISKNIFWKVKRISKNLNIFWILKIVHPIRK